MKLDDWEKIIRKLRNDVDSIASDVLEDSDEVKAFGELALLRLEIDSILQKYWLQARAFQGV